MKKLQHLILSGVALSLSGIIMLASESISISSTRILVPSLIIASGIFAILFANANTNSESKRPIQYLIFQGGIFVLFGLLCAFGAKNLTQFLSYATYFVLFTSLLDIILGFAIVNSDFKWTWGILTFKFIGGLMGLIGGVAILATSVTNQYSGLYITGIVIILMGIGTIIFATKINKVPA